MATQRISVDIEEDEHKYLKMCCAKLGISIKQFVIKATLESVYNQEDEWWLQDPETQQMLKDNEEGKLEFIPLEQVMKELEICV